MTPTDTNKLPAEVLLQMWAASAYKTGATAAQAIYDASPGPALEAENARLREALQELHEAVFDLAPHFDEPSFEHVEKWQRLDRAQKAARTAIARAKGE